MTDPKDGSGTFPSLSSDDDDEAPVEISPGHPGDESTFEHRGPVDSDALVDDVDSDEVSSSISDAGDSDDLRTGAWRTVGSGLDADIRMSSSVKARGVRMRRVGEKVEIEKLNPESSLKVDGVDSGVHTTVSLSDQVVEIDGVRITDDMVPVDTLDFGDLPDFFAPILIGRSPECDYQLKDDAVSARHAGLSRQEGYLLLEDLDSANGTYVEERRVKRVRIDWRTEFEIGGTVLTPLQVVGIVRRNRSAQSTSVLTALSVPGAEVPSRKSSLGPETGTSAAVSGVRSSKPAEAVNVRFEEGASLIVGRDPTADIVLDTPNVSRLHSRLERSEDGILVEDLGSTNGTWVNGSRIKGPTLVKPGDDLRFGPQRLELSEDLTVRTRQVVGGVTGVRLDASRLVREVGKAKKLRRVIDGVSFSILPGEMVAIMGPSGAGKTSALTTLAGYTPPSKGHVYMDGLSLYQHYDVFRTAIGYVPQEDVMHRTLTVREVLYYQAKLNFPAEVKDAEINDRISTVLRQLDLEDVEQSIVGDEVRRGLSGGQRKRLNVAMELLSEPSLLLLDEPTSGLDARSAMQLIRQCRGLASAGRTVVMTIHQPRREAFDLFDKLLLLTKGGKLAYFGPAREAKRYFTERSSLPSESAKNPADYVLDVLDPLDAHDVRPPEHWRKQFKNSPLFERFVRSRLRKEDRAIERRAAGRTRTRRANPIRQLITLTRRYARLKFRDKGALLVQLAQAPVIGLLAVLLFHQGRFEPLNLKDDVTPALFVLMASAVWFGCSNVAREIVSESAIFRRERYSNLRAGPYLMSKLLVQGFLVAIQIGLLLAILVPTVPLEGSVAQLAGVTFLAGLAAMSMGFLVSTVASTPLQAIQLVPLVILPQIMLSGILMPVGPPLENDEENGGARIVVVTEDTKPEDIPEASTASLLAKPVLLRWAYSAALQVELSETTDRGDKTRHRIFGAKYWERRGFPDDELRLDLTVMSGLGLFCVLGCWVLLLRRDRR
ncbi:MAG: FHA domain-containing protein [Proteobacteria bacterium]|nr:FHA domain-containing protein [Pseudomonadota bacterium]